MAKNIIKPSPFTTDQEPEAWIKLYEFTAQMNEWNDKQKLLYICNCIPTADMNWALRIVSQEDKTWEDFKALFLEKFAVRISSISILQSLVTFTMQPKESALAYIERMETLKLSYDQEITRRASDAHLFRSASLFPGQYETPDRTPTTTHPSSPDPQRANDARITPTDINNTAASINNSSSEVGFVKIRNNFVTIRP